LQTKFLTGDFDGAIAETKQLAPVRSAATMVDRINAHRPAVFLANAFEDSIFPPTQYTDFFTKLAGPKRLLLAHGDHATPEGSGVIGLPNETWDELVPWLRHYLTGTDNGADREAPVQVKVATRRVARLLQLGCRRSASYVVPEQADGLVPDRRAAGAGVDWVDEWDRCWRSDYCRQWGGAGFRCAARRGLVTWHSSRRSVPAIHRLIRCSDNRGWSRIRGSRSRRPVLSWARVPPRCTGSSRSVVCRVARRLRELVPGSDELLGRQPIQLDNRGVRLHLSTMR